jgi:hypothetical protein
MIVRRRVADRPVRVRRLPRPRWCSASLLLLAGALLWTPASIAATPADTAATYSYLQAGYQLDEAILQNAPASQSAVATIVERLGHECHGVLAGAPRDEFGPRSNGPATPRASGERQRSELQMQTIQEEVALTVIAAIYEPDRAASEAFAAKVAGLSWSDPRIVPLVRLDVHSLEEQVTPPVANLCADMKTWAQSGYHVLSPASHEFEATQRARSEAARPAGSLSLLLKPYEGARARALIRSTQVLRTKIGKTLAGTLRGFPRLQRALGIPQSPFEKREHEPMLGRGTTRAGATFVVRREVPRQQVGPSCKHSVSVELKEAPKGSHGSSDSSSSSLCLSGHPDHQPASGCAEDVESITVAVPASVRTVRLQLSNGQTITSPVIRIPRRYGGPQGVYVQAVRGPSPFPVSLTELDAQGKVVLVVKLHAQRCRREPAPTGPTFVELAKGTTPDGGPFSIQAAIVHFGRGQTSFNLELDAGLHGHRDEIEVGNVKPKAFPWSLGLECPPHEFVIIYGILSAPEDSVLARTPAGLVPLTKVALATDLHSGGPLVYGAFSTMPSELVILRSDGSTLYSESLAAKAKEEAEFCEGYSEG